MRCVWAIWRGRDGRVAARSREPLRPALAEQPAVRAGGGRVPRVSEHSAGLLGRAAPRLALRVRVHVRVRVRVRRVRACQATPGAGVGGCGSRPVRAPSACSAGQEPRGVRRRRGWARWWAPAAPAAPPSACARTTRSE